MRLLTPPALSCLLLSVVAQVSGQAKPDFSGRWTETEAATGRPAITMTIAQDSNAITFDRGQGLRWRYKLDGSQSKNITTQNNRPVEQFSTAMWEGSRLIISSPGRSNREGPWILREVWALEGTSLVCTSTQISETTKRTLREFKQTFSRR